MEKTSGDTSVRNFFKAGNIVDPVELKLKPATGII